MDFRLNFELAKAPFKINISNKILLMGSCFAENVGQLLTGNKFNVLINPNSILFNPISIFTALSDYIEAKIPDKEELFLHNGLWHSWKHHGSFSSPNTAEILASTELSTKQASGFIKECDYLILTFGSAMIYELKSTQEIVANCHKVPQTHFTKRLLRMDEIVSGFEKIYAKIIDINPGIKIILTVSPVRYIADDLVMNNLSKSILIQSVHDIIGSFNNIYYFPAYEIVIDELRDYRFYAKDMVHPSETAIEYVWERFEENMLDEKSKEILKEIKPIISAAKHRPINPASDDHKKFKAAFYNKCLFLKKKYPFLNFENELSIFEE